MATGTFMEDATSGVIHMIKGEATENGTQTVMLGVLASAVGFVVGGKIAKSRAEKGEKPWPVLGF